MERVHQQVSGGFFRCPDLKELYSREYDDKMNRWRAVCAIGNSSPWRAVMKSTVRRGLLSMSQSIASRVFTYHCGALCEPAPLLGI